ncbi:hypothetical protein J3Q64DRAFT_1702333 [Phycomyces blakesleeanus]|uniref:Uncharacterized protein n=2 Tax=Phycomyces blakesleeanus TaxID=4837 RepID=A0A163AP73_PHYB8|nr:hypothetical protein PHYBLDRAFT_61110 [Phycomyces blakesleeanus NRRL 1555(-)]OAD74841.1 hypothetical protein PHYBLDRAFT_61110 [Phycomyces blakesleeanus NRRL 1555(-)]|eukprot:XP_018292881.1 hypothetical protein PHYBLDRAFT_61110 [Phycomyces blakesleeanus NRRL 1555(-)]
MSQTTQYSRSCRSQNYSCPSCGLTEYRQSTHYSCTNNTINISENISINNKDRIEEETSFHVVKSVSEQIVIDIRTCSSCDSNTNFKIIHHNCPFNPERVSGMNENASTTLQYRIAYIVSFISESIIWPNICLSEGDQYARRSTLFSGFDPSTIKTTQNAINLCNAFIHTLKSVAEQFCDQPIGTLHVIFREAREIERHYNIQSSPEVAAMIIKESVDRVALLHNIIINNCITGYCSISLMNTTYITFHYVSMLSFGDNEWNMDLKCLSPNL